MSALPLADRLLLLFPLPLVLLAMLLAAVPWGVPVPLAPQVLWLAILTLGVSYPLAWPPAVAFIFGLLADTLSGTPLGSQALIALLMTMGMRLQSRRLQHQLFRVRWAQAAVMLLMANIMLWAIIGWLSSATLPLIPVLRTTALTALWFPLAYVVAEQCIRLLPARS